MHAPHSPANGVETAHAKSLAVIHALNPWSIVWRTELKDIELCLIAIGHSWDDLHQVSRIGLMVVQGMRRWTFLPLLLLTVPSLAINIGGDALTVCLNTVAVVFLCGAPTPRLPGRQTSNTGLAVCRYLCMIAWYASHFDVPCPTCVCRDR